MALRFRSGGILALAAGLLATSPAWATVTWYGGFDEEIVIGGLDQPTAFAFSSDGRIFVAEKPGRVRVITAAGELLAAPFATVSVNTQGDRGLIGLSLDPDFPSTPYVYLAYTTDIIPGAPNNSYSRIHRITRMTANGNTAVPGSEEILIDNIPSDGDSHAGGSMKFGPDGKLYVSTGDGSSYMFADPLALRSLDVNELVGKILRINPDGTVPTDNPFYTTPGANRSKVWQFGLRNPFKTAFRPSTGSLYINDVGWDKWEEINTGPAGSGFGWPCYEGNGPQSRYQSAFPSQCSGVSPTAPLYTYPHPPSDGGCITGGAFYTGGNYPSQYVGQYFIADYAIGWIKAVTLGVTDTFVSISDIAVGDYFFPVDLAQAPDGNLYYLHLATDFTFPSGTIRRILYVGAGNHAPKPVASASPGSGYAPLPVTFSAAGTTDADNDPLTYHWLFGDGAEASGPSVSHTYPANGSYIATLQVSDGQVTPEAKLTVTVGSLPPTATLASPPAYRTYVSGETISFSGSAFDPDDGMLGPGALRWTVLQHHETHVHYYQDTSGPSGSFLAVDHGVTGDLVYYELILTATDSSGLSNSARVFIYPNRPPVANAGPDQAVPCASPGSTVTLNGTASGDPDNQPIAYSWTQTGGPAVSLSGATTATPSFTAPVITGGATLTFQLTVNDGHVSSLPDSADVSVSVPGEIDTLRLSINGHTLSWDPIPGASTYDLLRGTLSGAFAYTHACRFTGFVNPTADDGPIPPVDTGYYYLARGVGACGPGTVGSASDATPRPNPLCP